MDRENPGPPGFSRGPSVLPLRGGEVTRFRGRRSEVDRGARAGEAWLLSRGVRLIDLARFRIPGIMEFWVASWMLSGAGARAVPWTRAGSEREQPVGLPPQSPGRFALMATIPLDPRISFGFGSPCQRKPY